MVKLLKELIEEMEAVGEIDVPESDVLKGEKILGEMSQEQKKLYTLKNKLTEEVIKLKIRTRLLCEDETSRTMAKGELLYRLFWSDICDSFGVWNKNIAIRKGWVVVLMGGD